MSAKTKFILKENKPIEKPKYILTEASHTEVAVSWSNWILNNFSTIENKIASIKELASVSKKRNNLNTLLDTLQSKIDEVENSKALANVKVDGIDTALETIKTELLDYLQTVDQVIKAAYKINPKGYGVDEGTKKDLEKQFNDLKKLLEQDLDSKTMKKALGIFDKVTKSEKSLDKVLGIGSDNAEATEVSLLRDLCSQLIDTLPELKNDLINETSAFTELAPEGITAYAKAVMELGTTFTQIIKKNPSNVAVVKQMASDFKTLIETALKQIETIDDSTVVRSKKVNWTELRTQAQSGTYEWDYFWNGNPKSTNPELKAGYFKAIWKEHADTIDNLGNNFTQTLDSFGVSEKTNPFIAYLKRCINTFNLEGMTKDRFITLRRSYVRYQLSKDDLWCNSKSTFGPKDIIFNGALYTVDVNSMEKYLNARGALVASVDKLPKKIKDFFEKGQINAATVLNNLLLSNGNAENLTAPITNLKGTLRTVTDVEDILRKLNIENVVPEEEATEKPSQEKLNGSVSKITDEATAKKALSYLVDFWRSKYKTVLKNVDDLLAGRLFKNRDSVYPTYAETTDIESKLALQTTTWDADSVKKLLLALADKAGLSQKIA